MKKRISIILALMLCLSVLSGGAAIAASENADGKPLSFGSFSGVIETNATLTPSGYRDWDAFYDWYYVPETVPEGFSVTTSVYEEIVIRLPNDGWNVKHPISAASLDFVSGSETLFNKLYMYHFTDNEGNERTIIYSNPFPETGETVFRIRVESADGLYAEVERTLRVLSWEDYPQFEFLNGDHSGTARRGLVTPPGGYQLNPDGTMTFSSKNALKSTDKEKYENLFTEDELIALAVKDHTAEIVSSVLPANEKQYASYYNRLSLCRKNEEGKYVSMNYSEYPDSVFLTALDDMNMSTVYMFKETGEYCFSLFSSISHTSAYFTIKVSDYGISGPKKLSPGRSGTYTVWDDQPDLGRTFTMTAQGDGADFDAATNTLTVSADTPSGTVFTIQAVPSDGGEPAVFVCTVASGLLGDEQFIDIPAGGFSLPFPDPNKYQYSYYGNTIIASGTEGDSDVMIMYDFTGLDSFVEKTDAAEKLYSSLGQSDVINTVLQEETVMIDDHPAGLLIGTSKDGNTQASVGIIDYARNNVLSRITVYSSSDAGEPDEVTMGDLLILAGKIKYDPTQADITVEDGELTVTAKDDLTAVTAGKNLQLTAVFAKPDKVNQKQKNNKVSWTVTDAESGEPADYAKISNNGQLSVSKTVEEVKNLRVTAVSDTFGTSADLDLTVIPAVNGIVVEPKEVVFYAGSSQTAALTASITPEAIPASALTWTVQNDKVVGMEAAENGTVVIRPLIAGKTVVEAKEPGGKNARVSVSVLEPVTGITLTAKGSMKANGTVNISAVIEPKKAGNKDLEWTIDADENTATLGKNGRLKIGKDVPAGTVITVTCTAAGAPEPVTATIQIVVEE